MADTTTTLKIRAIDDGAIATVNNVSLAFTGLTLGTTALAVGFSGLQKATLSSAGQMVLGSENANKLAASLSKLTDVNNAALKSFSALSDITFLGGQFLTFAKGVQDAAAVYARIPQTFDLFRSSGVSTQPIEDFYTLTDAIKGSEASLEAFAVSAVQNLGRFEQAAARAGTILRSNTNFDESGGAKRATKAEQLENAFQVQEIVNQQLNNTVKSTDALLGQYEVLSSGFAKAADSQQVLTAGLKLTGIGQAGGVAADPGETLRLLGKTLNAYQLSASEAAKTAATLNAIVENGITTVPELSQGFGQTATTARAAGIALDDLAASTAVLTTQGINTATALTGLQGVSSAITQKTPEAQKALEKLSLNGQKIRFDQAEIQSKGFTKALIDLNTAAGGNVKVLQEIFPEALTFRTVLALLAQDGKKLESVLSSVSSTTAGSLDEVFQGATGDRISRFEQIANKFQELIIKVAASVAPVFEPGIEVLGRIAKIFSDLPEGLKQAVGQFIAFQLTTRATAGAVGILFQTMLNLGSTYLQVRLLSLGLSGQLGKELSVIRELIVQKKGLLSAALQLLGVDQRYRLSVEASTAAMEKQGIVAKAVTVVRTKASEVVNKTVETATGLNVEQIKEQGKKAITEVKQTAQNVALGVGEAVGAIPTAQILGPDGKPLNSTGVERIKQEAQKVGNAIAEGAKQGAEGVGLLGADGKLLSEENLKQQAEKATNAVKETAKKTQDALQSVAPKSVFEILTADSSNFEDGDKQLQSAKKKAEELRQAEIAAKKDILKANEEFNAAKAEADKKAAKSEKATNKVNKVFDDPESTQEQREKALTKAIQKRSEAEEAAGRLADARDNVIQKRETFEQIRGARIDQEINLLGEQEKAAEKYTVASQKQALARRFNSQSIALQEKATLAKAKADELELIAQIRPQDIQLQTELKKQRALATAYEEKASQFKARAELEAAAATELVTQANRSAILAEMGLAETRIFGRNVTFSTQGPIGAVNALLATEVSLKTANIAVTKVLTAVQSGLSTTLSKSFELLKSGGMGAVSLLQSGFTGLGNAVTGLIGSLGPLGILLAGVGLTVAVFKDDLFGLRKTANEAAAGLREMLKADDDLAKKFGKEERLLRFKAEIKQGDVGEIQAQLTELKLSGDITTGQFDRLNEVLASTAQSGQLAADGVEKFKNQIESIKQGAIGKPEKGAYDVIGGFIGDRGKNLLDFPGYVADIFADPLVNTFKGIRSTLTLDFASAGRDFGNILGLDGKTSSERIRANKDADRTVQSRSELRLSSERFGDANLVTSEQIREYRNARGLTTETDERIKSGEKLTSDDIERERQIFEERKARNEQLISQFDQQIKKQQETIDQVKDPELKASYQGQLDSVIAQRNALEKRNEALKQGNEEFIKYYTETLPGIKRAITESTNFEKALANAETNFQQQFKLDANGKPTAYLKDNATLRSEAQQFQSQILENYQAGVFEKSGDLAELEVAKRLRSVRDDKITTPDGVTGFRLTVNDRIAATQQIVEFEQAASKKRGENLKLEAEQIKLSQQQKLISSENAEKQINQIQLESIRETLRQKEIEIQEYAQFPVRKAQLEKEAAAIRIQIEQNIATESNRILEKQRQRRQEIFNIEAEEVKARKSAQLISEEQTQKQLSQIEIAASRDRLRNLISDFNKSGRNDVDVANKIKSAELQLQQLEESENRRKLESKRERIQETFALSIERIKYQQSAKAISEQQAKRDIALTELESTRTNLNNLIVDYNKLTKPDQGARSKINTELLRYRQQEQAYFQFESQLEDERQKRALSNFNQSQVLALQSESSKADLRSKDLERNRQLVNSTNQLQSSITQVEEARLQRQLKFTGDVEKQAQIEFKIAENRFKNLEVIQRQERESLDAQNQINKLSLDREAIQLRIQKIQNQGQALELKNELIKAKRDKKTPEEIKAIELQLEGVQQQGDLLKDQEKQLDKNRNQQLRITELSRRELLVKQENAKAESAIEMVLARRRELQGKIEKQVENIRFGSQQISIAGQIQIRQSEAISKAFDYQKSLLQSVLNIQKGKVDIVTGELQLASELSDNDNEKKNIAIAVAAIKLSSLENQLSAEEKILDINLAQQAAQLETEKIRNRVAQASNKAEIAQAQADLFKLQADPKSTPQQIQAAQLNLQAKVEGAIATQFEGSLLEQQGVNQSVLGRLEKQQFQQRATLQRNQAQVEFARATGDSGIMNRTKERILGSALGGISGDEINASLSAFVQQKTYGNNGLTPLEQQRAARVMGNLGVEVPQTLQMQFPNFEEFRKNQLSRFQEFGYKMPSQTSPQELNKAGEQNIKDALNKLSELVDKKLGTPNQVGVTANITNNFNSADKEAGTTVVNQIRNELSEILKKVNQK